MAKKVDRQGRVTLPKPLRDAVGLQPGATVDFAVDGDGRIVLRRLPDRFDRARGAAEVKWDTDDLITALRGSAPT